jgi:hypothetical protein
MGFSVVILTDQTESLVAEKDSFTFLVSCWCKDDPEVALIHDSFILWKACGDVLHSRESRFHFNQLLSAQYCHGFQLYLLFSFDGLVVEHRNVFRISYFVFRSPVCNDMDHTRATVNRFVFGFAIVN